MLIGFLVGVSAKGQIASSTVEDADLTIEIDDDLRKQGRVILVYPIPVPPDVWLKATGERKTVIVRLEERYAQVQFRYPENKTYRSRFRGPAGESDSTNAATQVLSVIGTSDR